MFGIWNIYLLEIIWDIFFSLKIVYYFYFIIIFIKTNLGWFFRSYKLHVIFFLFLNQIWIYHFMIIILERLRVKCLIWLHLVQINLILWFLIFHQKFYKLLLFFNFLFKYFTAQYSFLLILIDFTYCTIVKHIFYLLIAIINLQLTFLSFQYLLLLHIVYFSIESRRAVLISPPIFNYFKISYINIILV